MHHRTRFANRPAVDALSNYDQVISRLSVMSRQADKMTNNALFQKRNAGFVLGILKILKCGYTYIEAPTEMPSSATTLIAKLAPCWIHSAR